MKTILLFLLLMVNFFFSFANNKKDSIFFRADHPNIQYTGRFDFSNPFQPRFWAPGTYVTIRFRGSYCIMQLTDEVRWGRTHNYIEVIVDDNPPVRLRMNKGENRIILAKNLSAGKHKVVICKNTEAEIGYLQLAGFTCKQLLTPPKAPCRNIEFIGNSITCGMGNDESSVPCNTGEWYDQHNAYMAYGPLTARSLKAQWQLSSVSGIGLIHSCCNKTYTMPDVFDKINMTENKLTWNFKQYQPDAVTVCLGQNDGIQDSATYCSAYIKFAATLRSYYPSATIVLLSSPMASTELDIVLKKYINAVIQEIKTKGDQKIASYFFSKQFNKGCTGHPNAKEHQEMAIELSAFLKKLMNW